jgi:hypothetical protein
VTAEQDIGEGGEQHDARQTAEHDPNDPRQKHYSAQIQKGAFPAPSHKDWNSAPRRVQKRLKSPELQAFPAAFDPATAVGAKAVAGNHEQARP